MKISQGIVYKRRQKILQDLLENGSVLVEDLAKQLNVSEITIRRDLQTFDDAHIIDRFHGGARLIEGAVKSNLEIQPVEHEANNTKHTIAKMAASMVKEGDIVFINSGSTAFLLLNYLSDKQVTIITNNGKALTQLESYKVDLVLSGGEIYEQKQSLVGDFAIHSFSKVTANICFLGVSGIKDTGITTFALPETAVNKIILERTNGPRIVVTEGRKVGQEHNFHTADISYITHLITDHSANPLEIEKLKRKNIEVIFVD